MDEKIDKVIELLVMAIAQPGANPKPTEAQQLSQAAQNLANVRQILYPKAGGKKPTSES